MAKDSVSLATSSNTNFGATPAALAKFLNVLMVDKLVSKLPPEIICIDLANLAALCPVSPVACCIPTNLVRELAVSPSIVPNSSAVAVTKFLTSSALPPIALRAVEATPTLAAKTPVSTAPNPNSCLSSKALSSKPFAKLRDIAKHLI